MQKGWKSTKKYAKKGYNFALGDDIQTLSSPKSKWYYKAGAAVSIASNFIPGAGTAKLGIKAAVKGTKGLKHKKFFASSIKQNRIEKVKSKKVSNPTPLKLDLQFFASKGPGNVHKNSNSYVGNQGVYKIDIDGSLHKYGKADMTKLASTGNPKRLQTQVNKLQRQNPNSQVTGRVIYQNKRISTTDIKKIEGVEKS